MIVFFHFTFSFIKYLWDTYVHNQVTKDLKILFETNNKTEAFEKYENRRLNCESLGIGHNSYDHNLKWTTEDGDLFQFSDFQLNFDPAYYFENNIRFCPPVFQQRYLTIAHIINNPKWKGKIRKVVEFGCAELALLNHLKLIQGIREINLVDIDGQLLRDNVYRVQPWFCESYNFERAVPLTVNVLRGSVSHPDRHCKAVDAVIAIELIEHMYEDELSQLPQNIFGYIKPRLAIFTTPNSDFNVLFINFSGFRHDDHKFEWSRKEFEAWANNICVQYPDYEVHFIGIGPPPPGKEHLGYCSQGAVFMRVQFDADNQDCEELNTESYELIETTEFPVVEQLDPDYKTAIDAGHYIRICERHGEFHKNYKTVIPLSLILVRVYKTCKSTEKLRQILEEKYKIEENSDGEEVVVYSGEEDESDSGLDENCPTNGVQATDDQWERRSCSSWGSVRDKGESEENGWGCAESEVSAGAWGESEQVPTLVEDNLEQNRDCKESGEIKTLETGDNVDSNQLEEENWDYEASEQVKSSEARVNVDSHEYGEENWDSGEIEVPVPVRPTSSVNSDASCGNLDDLKEILSNLPALQPYCEPDFVFDPAQASDSNFILEDTRSVGLETIVSVSDENYESSLVSSDSLIRRTDSSSVFVMDGSHYTYNEPGEGSQWDLNKSKSLHSVGGTLVSAKSSHEVKATKSLESVTEKREKVSEKSGDDLKSWKSLHCVSEKRIYSPEKSYSDSKALDCIESGVKTVKVLLPNTLEQQEGVGEKLKKLDCFVDKDGLVNSEKYSSNITVLPSVCDIRAGSITDDVVKGIETSQTSFVTSNLSKLHGKDENDPKTREIPPSTSETRHDNVMQGLTKCLHPFQVNLDSNDSCYREEKLSIDLPEEQLSDFDSSSSLHLHCADVSNVCGLDNISGSTSKLPISIRNSTSSLLEESSVEEQLLDKIGSYELSNFKANLLQPFETKISETGPEVIQSLDSVENNTCLEDQKFEEICVNSFEKKLLNPDCSTKEAETSQFEKLAQKSESTLNELVNNSGSVEKDEQPFAEVHKCDSSSSNLTYVCDVDSSESKELLMNDGSSSRYVSDIEFDDVLSRPSLSKESELSYKSCDTSIRDKDSRGDLGNMCLPDLDGLNLSKDAKLVDSSSSGSKNNLDEARRFSSTSFIFKSQSQERIKEIYSFRSIGSEKSENCKIINEGKDCDTSSPLHKCYSTGKISRGFSAYNEGVISNSCVNKLSSSLAGEPEFFDKNNDLARERRCMSVSCIGNINVDYDENSCLEERELQNSCSPDKFGPDSGYPNSSSGLDMEMDTPEQVKEIMTESESSFDESLESPVVEEEDLPFDNNPGLHPPVIPVGENVENGDVANNNRDGEGNNMVGDGIVGDALQFHALIEENEGNLQLMGAACNEERVSEGCKHVGQSKTSTEVLVGDIESVCVELEGSTETGSTGNDIGKENTEFVESKGTRSSENFAEVEETQTTSHEVCLSTLDQNQASNVDQTSSVNSQETNNNCDRRSSSCKVEENAPPQIDLPLSGSISVNTATNNNSDQRLASSDSSQNLRSKIDHLSIRCSSSASKNSDQGTISGNVDENRQSLIDLPLSTCSSTTNNSTDQGYSSSHSEHNLRSQIDAPLTSTYRGKRIDQQCRIQAERDLRLKPDLTSNRCLSTYKTDESETLSNQLGQNRGLESDLPSTSSLSTNNSTNPGSASNLRLQSDLPSSSSSSTNNSTDLRCNVRPQSDPPSSTNNSSDLPSTSSLTTHFNSDHSSSSFHPDQNLWSHLDLPSTRSYADLNIENVDDLNSLVPLSLVEIVLNRLIREVAEDVLLEAEEVLVVEDYDQGPIDFMGGGDSAAENM